MLTRYVDLKIEHVPIAIYSCFILHNFCEPQKSDVEEELVKNQIEIMKKR